MAKKRFMVVPRTQSAMMNGLDTTKGKFGFNGKTARIVDESLASEIDTQHGLKGSGDVWVHQDENLEWHERNDGLTDGRKLGIHHYTFAGVDIEKRGGNERVRIGNGVFLSMPIAIEEGYEIFVKQGKYFGKKKVGKIVSNKVRNNRDAKHGKRKGVYRNVTN